MQMLYSLSPSDWLHVLGSIVLQQTQKQATSFQERLGIRHRICAVMEKGDKVGNHKHGHGRDFTVEYKTSTATVIIVKGNHLK